MRTCENSQQEALSRSGFLYSGRTLFVRNRELSMNKHCLALCLVFSLGEGGCWTQQRASGSDEMSRDECESEMDCVDGQTCMAWSPFAGSVRTCEFPCSVAASVVGCPDGTSCVDASHLPLACSARQD